MSEPSELENAYRTLEVDPQAPLHEIEQTYRHLLQLYQNPAHPLALLFEDEENLRREQEETVSRLQEAWALIQASRQEERTGTGASSPDPEQRNLHPLPEFQCYDGNALRIIRNTLGIVPDQVAHATGIPLRHVSNLEGDAYAQLPPLAYTRAFVRSYAEFLGIDADRAAHDYIQKMTDPIRHRTARKG